MNRFMPLFLAALFFAAGCVGPAASNAGSLKDDQMFSLKTPAGSTVSLDAALKANKAVLVNFWATWCPPCREEIPDLVKLYAAKKDLGLEIIGVNVGESAKRVAPFAEKYGMTFPIALDEDQSVAEAYGVVGIPTTLLVASDGRVIGTYHAYTDQLVSDVEQALK
jgi:peroxiredoxin